MGAGTYWAVVYGCRDVRANGNGKKLDADDDLQGKLDDVFHNLSIQTSYEGASQYAGFLLLHTLTGTQQDREIPGNVMSITELPDAIRKAAGRSGLGLAKRAWETACRRAVKIGIELPEGELLWLSDYD
jgi:hypothetical protein